MIKTYRTQTVRDEVLSLRKQSKYKLTSHICIFIKSTSANTLLLFSFHFCFEFTVTVVAKGSIKCMYFYKMLSHCAVRNSQTLEALFDCLPIWQDREGNTCNVHSSTMKYGVIGESILYSVLYSPYNLIKLLLISVLLIERRILLKLLDVRCVRGMVWI